MSWSRWVSVAARLGRSSKGMSDPVAMLRRGKGGAMVAVNVVVLAGRLSDAPEIKSMPSGDQVTRFRLHVPEAGKRVLPLPVSAWDKLARKGCERLVKGDSVLVRGHLVRRFFRDGGGGRSVTEVVATEVKKLEKQEDE
jgi:single-strand DNA-binding protein